PFKTLLGHRLVMNEAGKPMHKSDGTAIWFEEAAEQIGVDTMRWMYLQQNPAQDLRFGTRHPEQKVTLETVDGPRETTIDGVPTCKVESGPADEVRRQVLLPLWNSYSFFVNYARLDDFDPSLPEIPFAERPQIDQWILTNLQSVITGIRSAFENYDTPAACGFAAAFVDDLSNWYIRRSVPQPSTLNPQPPESVHLCDFPVADVAWSDPSLLDPMKAAQAIVQMGHRLRETINQRVRQPLAEVRVGCRSAATREHVAALSDVIADELNVKQVVVVESLGELVTYKYRANPASLGKRYGKLLNKLREVIATMTHDQFVALSDAGGTTIRVEEQMVDLIPDDVSESVENASGWASASDGPISISLSTELTPDLIREGMSRDFVRHVQQMRKDADLEIEQRIRITYATDDAEAHATIREWAAYIQGETLAVELSASATIADTAKRVMIGEVPVHLAMALTQTEST
ncbi:MAG: isoleucine--tRNA ligase, partial [Planctomycetales bacterium 12-60-4]